MKWILFIILLTGCAVDNQPTPSPIMPPGITARRAAVSIHPLTETSIELPNAPLLIETDPCNWRIDWPTNYNWTNYYWTVQTTTNFLTWEDHPQQWDSSTLVITPPPKPYWLRLHGITNSP